MCRKGFSCGQSTVAVGVAFKTKAELDAFMAAVRSGEAEIRDWRVRVHDNPKLLKMYVTDILEKSGQTAALHVHMPGMFHAEVVALMEAKGDGPHITVFVSRDICDVCRLKDLPKNLPAASDGGSVTFIDRVGSGETTEEKFMRMYKITRKDPTKPRIVLADVLAAPKAVPFPGCVLGGLCPDLCQAPECPHYAAWGSDKCVGHGGGARCQEEGCDKGARWGLDKCARHGGGARCQEEDCDKGAPSGSDKCFGHGGGARCQEEGCDKGAASGSDKCVGHGGGARCQEEGCDKSARRGSDKCVRHGGGARCQEEDCDKGAASGSDKCSRHGGGARCQEEGCDKGKVGGYVHCRNHGGGNGCTGCDKKGDKNAMSRKIVPTSTVECKKCADMSSGRSKRKSQTIGGKKTKATKTT